MKDLVNFVLKNKLAVWLLTIIITVFGLYAGTRMKMESIPNISVPFLVVMGVYPGATPEKVMDELSIPLEKAVEGLEDVEAVTSTSSPNVVQLQIEYAYGIDMDEKRRQLQTAVDSVTLPDGVDEPTIMSISLNMMPVVALSVSSRDEDIVELTSTVEEVLVPKIEKIDGVSSATITGQHIEQVSFTYDEEKMARLGVTESDVQDMLEASNLGVSLGLYDFAVGKEAVAIDGKLGSVEALRELQIPVTPTAEQPAPFITLGDIAQIDVEGLVQSVSRTNGEDAIAIQIVKGQQANTVTVVDAVKALIEEEQQNSGLQIAVTLDQGQPIKDSVFTMMEKALFGGFIAVVIILLFLRDVKSTIISVISIPVSICLALLLLNYLDITLNIMTIGAMTVAIGRVIDDSIVVVENIYRRIHLKEEKLHGRALIREATIEMFKPILSSTLVTVAVFAPLIFVGGMVGELFLPFALTMTFALGASLLVAITIVPALSHVLFKNKLYGDKLDSQHKDVGALAKWYRRFLEKCLNRKWLTSLVAVVLLAGSLALTPLIGFSFLGSMEEKTMNLTYTPKTGELMADTEKNIEEVEQYMLAREDINTVQVSINDPDNVDPQARMMGRGGNGALMYVMFDPEMDNFPQARDEVTDYLEALTHSGTWQTQNFSMGMGGSEVSYTLYSEDLDDLSVAVKEIERALTQIDGLQDVSSDFEDAYVEHVFVVDQQNVLQYGVTTAQILMALAESQIKEVLTTVQHDGEELEVIVKREKNTSINALDDLLDVTMNTAQGEMRIGELVEVREGTTLNSLKRSEGEYQTTVSGTITKQDISKVTTAADEKIAALDLPKGVTMGVSGVAADMEETFSQLGVAMLAAIAIVYFILVVTFGEGLAPFAILFSLPFTIIGAWVGLYVTNQTISVSVLMGLLMLIGIVVTNAIVLVDRIIQMEHAGLAMREAILEAGATRLRPILMTAIATMGAMLPMAFGAGGGGLVSKDLAITVIGGLFTSTILTLIIVPIVYELLSRLLKKNRLEIEEE